MQNNELIELSGIIEQIIYRNDNNGYTVLELETESELVTIVGTFPQACCGESLKVLGNWTNHSTFGRQFKAEFCERSLPATSAAILKYLSSGSIKGIRAATAQKILSSFGEETLDVIENHPERLATIKGITLKKAQDISDDFKSQFGIREVMLFFGQYNITPNEAVKAWKKWNNTTIERIQENPYLLCTEGLNISFERADQIAASMDKAIDNPSRICAGILYILRHNMGGGHTCLPYEKLLPIAQQMLGVGESETINAYKQMILSGDLIEDTIEEKVFVFFPRMYQAEVYSAERLKMLLSFPAQQYFDVEDYLQEIEFLDNIQYQSLQREAIITALTKGLLVLTGGPGTGKTTTLNAIIKILESKGETVYLAAPTGRAAKRMSEVTKHEAKTIHRLLEAEWTDENKSVFGKNEKNTLDCDTLILDELSMISSALFENVLKSLKLGVRLIMVGDTDQLPSVGAGNVLGDLIASGKIPVVQLTEIFRQSMDSLIVTNAHQIVKGEMPNLSVRNNDFFFLPFYNPQQISSTIIDLCKERLPKSYNYTVMESIQVLCPSRKGELGTIELNKKLQTALNPYDKEKKEILIGTTLLREGDKVMQTKNNYDIPWNKADATEGEGVFNGDIGTLVDIQRNTSSLMILFDDRLALYTFEQALELELAYAVTVHKSQGNEFEAVVMPMFQGPSQLYYRNLLYTAITRAKKLLIMVGTPNTVYDMVKNDKKSKRYSALQHFLKKGEN